MLRLSLDFSSNDSMRRAWRQSRRLPNIFKVAWIWGVLIALITGTSGLCAGSGPFSAQLESIIKRELPADQSISIQVVDFTSGTVLMEKNPDLPLVPASTMKVVTSSTALQVLNPEYHFVTEVYVDSAR